jgi:hypothetical protein
MLNEMWELCHRPITGPGVSDLPFGVVIESPPASPVAAGTDELVAINGGTADYLDDVLIAGNGITLTPDGNTLEIAASDEKVAIDGGTADYLDNVLVVAAGDEWIRLSPGGNTLEISHWGPGEPYSTVDLLDDVQHHKCDYALKLFHRRLVFDYTGHYYGDVALDPTWSDQYN